jgi:hypothetical protein
MADDGKDETTKKGQSRRGFVRYGSNPSVPENGLQEVKRRPVQIPGSGTGVQFVDGTTGELVGSGIRQ